MKSLDLSVSPPLDRPTIVSPVSVVRRSLSLREAFGRLRHRDSSTSSRCSSSGNSNSDNDAPSKQKIRKEEKRRSQDAKRQECDTYAENLVLRRRKSSYLAAESEGPDMRARYGVLSPNIYATWHGNDWKNLSELSAMDNGQTVILRVRIHMLRKLSSKMLFLVFRQQFTTMQAVLGEEANLVSTHMVHWASRLALEDIVTVRGIVQRPLVPITGASITDAEVR
jgi:hypothetical protein